MNHAIYLDGFATLPLAPEARHALVEALSLTGNAASPHGAGEQAAMIIERGRREVAALIGAAPSEIVFTSGATEANNLALIGIARALRAAGSGRRRLIVSAVEHKAVLEPARALQGEGFELAYAPVDAHGRLDLGGFKALLGPDTLLASIMAVNNETGTIQPIGEAAALAHEAGALFHTDAAQAAGKIPIDVLALDVDYLSLSAHKCYGPMGVGALYISASAPKPAPLQHGGGQQGGVRPGTEPVALIAGFGAAAKVASDRLDTDRGHGERLARTMLEALGAAGLPIRLATGSNEVVPGSLCLAVEGADADDLCVALAGRVHLSTGSACTSGQLKGSHVLEAMGFSEAKAREVVRMFCHRYLREKDVEIAAARIIEAVRPAISGCAWRGSPVAYRHEAG
jgi:cysteine desulfurase